MRTTVTKMIPSRLEEITRNSAATEEADDLSHVIQILGLEMLAKFGEAADDQEFLLRQERG